MPVEPHIFQQVVELMPLDMLELISTVGAAAQLNIPLIASSHDKVAIACIMLSHASAMLEQCGCTIETTINNPNWINPIIYKKEINDIEGIL